MPFSLEVGVTPSWANMALFFTVNPITESSILFQTIKEGVLVLGRVRSVYDTKLIVMLPCKLIGNVMACHISEPYNKLLEDYVNDKVKTH